MRTAHNASPARCSVQPPGTSGARSMAIRVSQLVFRPSILACALARIFVAMLDASKLCGLSSLRESPPSNGAGDQPNNSPSQCSFFLER